MIYITGDTHANFHRFNTANFPEQKEMTKDDFVIICGDFGGVWDYEVSGTNESYWLDWLNNKPFTLLFVDGNHDNFDRLNHNFPVVDFHGGKAHKIRDSIYHLLRGYVFDFEGKKFFCFGGAKSHDIQDGVLQLTDYDNYHDLIKDYRSRRNRGEMVRINHLSWWEEELPSEKEMQRGRESLEKVGWKVNFVITHCLPQSVCSVAGYRSPDILTIYFDKLIQEYGLKFNRWYSGHYHIEDTIMGKFVIKYESIERIL